MDPKSGTILAAVLADILADGLDIAQLSVLASFISAVSSNLGYIASRMDLNEQIAGNQNEIAEPPVIPPTPLKPM